MSEVHFKLDGVEHWLNQPLEIKASDFQGSPLWLEHILLSCVTRFRLPKTLTDIRLIEKDENDTSTITFRVPRIEGDFCGEFVNEPYNQELDRLDEPINNSQNVFENET